MKVTVCIGSSCHVRGSRQVVEQLQDLIRDHNLSDAVRVLLHRPVPAGCLRKGG